MGYDRGTVFLSILKQIELHLVQNRKENCPRDHILFNLRGKQSIVFSVYTIHQLLQENVTEERTVFTQLTISFNGLTFLLLNESFIELPRRKEKL